MQLMYSGFCKRNVEVVRLYRSDLFWLDRSDLLRLTIRGSVAEEDSKPRIVGPAPRRPISLQAASWY
jgi:hypothetical protein